MENKNLIVSLVLVIVLLFVSAKSTYIVNEAQQTIITRFGKPIGDPITEPGLYWKIPFVEDVNYFDKRFLEWDGSPDEVPTKEKTYIYVDTYARWRIADPLLFFQKVQNETRAQSRLDDILDGAARIAISNHDLFELVRMTNRKLVREEGVENNADVANDIFDRQVKKGRAGIVKEIIETSQLKAQELGIEILDFRFKRIKYNAKVQNRIYDRMITERTKIADKFLSEGRGAFEKILGDKTRDLLTITSEAQKQSEIIRGLADAEATKIYANAYNRNADSRNFYNFVKTMETYKKTMSKNDILMLSTKSEFFKYFKGIN